MALQTRRHDITDARRRILDAAEDQFSQHGFDATPTAKVAAAAGVPKGLLFYYFPTKLELLRALLAERMPGNPLCDLDGIARHGDLAGSLIRLGRRLDLGGHESIVLRTIIFREAQTHPEVLEHIRALRTNIQQLAESVIEAASPRPLAAALRRDGARAFVSVLMDEASRHRTGGPSHDGAGAIRIIANGLVAEPA